MKPDSKQLQEKFKNLPRNIKRAITSIEVGEALQKIGRQNKLHIDQIGDLAEKVTLVMFGFLHPKQFSKSIKKDLNLTDKQAEQITIEIDEQIFKPIRSSLHEVNSEELTEIKSEIKLDEIEKVKENNTINDNSTPTKTPATPFIKETKEYSIEEDSKKGPINTDPYREPIE